MSLGWPITKTGLQRWATNTKDKLDYCAGSSKHHHAGLVRPLRCDLTPASTPLTSQQDRVKHRLSYVSRRSRCRARALTIAVRRLSDAVEVCAEQT